MPTDRGNLKAVNLRIREDMCSLIDKAASIQGRSRADFIIEAARRAAEEAILNQRVIMVSRERYDHLLAALDRPPVADEKLVKLLRTKAPWDQ
ncbi:type II toxin-antitoxin system TacA family antitoxin [Sphingobium baderi]|uniref:type II toxin-antitoxin system TacA family antitoxin n=1 Tax=Sphingobium baderi TaxID=1332080 RepID=UPI002B413E6A|nr:DUF1778 domain-containing protein [Sphingobium baderi]WRD77826.1 DUF1778 domain-containing protein [Sphingobium baderi]